MKFIDVVKKFISPLLSVNEVRLIKKECLKKTPSDFCTKESQKLSLRKEKVKNGNKIELIRTQTFSDEERLIVDEFLSFLSSKNLYKTASELDYSIYSKVLELTMLKTAMAGIENNTFFRDLSFLLDYWSNRTYEGNKISFAIKIRDITNAKKVFFDECKQDYFASLSNGVDEYIQLNDSGEVDKIIFCEEKDLNAQAPLRFLKLAKASNDCVITALTRNSEILIFKDEKIWAAKRNMQWILYTHDTYLKKMSLGIPKWTKNLKETMYQTALDTSFTKTGAILAMLFYDEKKEEIENILNSDEIKIQNGDKISSNLSDIFIKLVPTPKVISQIKEWDKNIFLVGFKLLSNVTSGTLIDVAKNLMQKNKCDVVVANDKKDITENTHKAYIITNNEIINAETKNEIAEKLSDLIKGI